MSTGDHQRIGQVLAGRYELTDVVGRGGMATVYRARDRNLGRFVAVKFFAPGTAIDDARRRAEVDLLARVNHPNLVALHDAQLAPAESEDPSYIVMELVEGPDLRKVLDAGPLSGPATALLAAEIAEALAVVHAQGIVHRDLKPANILLAPTGLPSPKYHARLTDFGIAHLVGADRVTTAGTVIGTAAYLSPEQAAGAEPGSESDIYALGLLLLECLTGIRVYSGTAVEAMTVRAARDPAMPDDLPVEWASLLTQMTSRDPGLRPTAVDVAIKARKDASALDEWVAIGAQDGSPVTEATAAMLTPTRLLPPATAATVGLASPSPLPSPAAPATARPRRRLAVAAGAVVLAGAVIAGAVFATSGGGPPEEPAETPAATSVPSPVPTTDSPEPPATVAPVVEEPTEPEPEPETGNSGNGNGNGNGNSGNGNDKKPKKEDKGNGK
ncbi:serine/threonine-protein kinase [Leifsonia sp. YIM 134122]|uniref:non-specific serine/threonine protein kinase n=1 Tax=Leifsonia stereocauli TaxID=3134136 RepID=A0ABU9W7Q7_9MICO